VRCRRDADESLLRGGGGRGKQIMTNKLPMTTIYLLDLLSTELLYLLELELRIGAGSEEEACRA